MMQVIPVKLHEQLTIILYEFKIVWEQTAVNVFVQYGVIIVYQREE